MFGIKKRIYELERSNSELRKANSDLAIRNDFLEKQLEEMEEQKIKSTDEDVAQAMRDLLIDVSTKLHASCVTFAWDGSGFSVSDFKNLVEIYMNFVMNKDKARHLEGETENITAQHTDDACSA